MVMAMVMVLWCWSWCSPRVKEMMQPCLIDLHAMQGTTIASHPVLHEIGLKYERSAAQVAIAWQVGLRESSLLLAHLLSFCHRPLPVLAVLHWRHLGDQRGASAPPSRPAILPSPP